MMSDPQNHNFWFASRRYYIHVGNGKWVQTPAPEFFFDLKRKIWKFYYTSLCQFLSRTNCNPLHIEYLYGALTNSKLSFSNKFLLQVFEPYKFQLRRAFHSRVKSRVKVI